jgi:hypothetical protein
VNCIRFPVARVLRSIKHLSVTRSQPAVCSGGAEAGGARPCQERSA